MIIIKMYIYYILGLEAIKLSKKEPLRFPVYLTNILMGLALSVYILFPGTEGYESIQNAKFEVFSLLFGGYLLLIILFSAELALIRRIRSPKIGQIWQSAVWEEKLIVIYWILTLISTLVSPYGQGTLLGLSRYEGFLTQTIYCGTFLCVGRFARPKAWMMYLFSAVMSVFCGICILQMQGRNPLGLYPAGTDYFGANVDYPGIYLGTTGNADLTAALLCLAIPAFAVWLVRGKQRGRFLAVIPLILCVVTLVRADVKAGLVGTICGMAVVLPAVLPVKSGRRKWLWLALGGLVLVGLWYGYTNQRTWGLPYEVRQILHGNFDSALGSGRIGIWKDILSRVPERLIFGYGPDTMAAAQIAHYTHVINGVEVPLIIDVAHNEYLNILYHQGILALLIYLLALGRSFLRWLACGSKDTVSAICGGAVLCYCVQAFFGFSMCQTAVLFWMAWAVLNSQLREDRT